MLGSSAPRPRPSNRHSRSPASAGLAGEGPGGGGAATAGTVQAPIYWGDTLMLGPVQGGPGCPHTNVYTITLQATPGAGAHDGGPAY